MMSFTDKAVRKRSIWWRLVVLLGLVCVLFATSYYFYLYNEVRQRFESRRWSIPARVFSATVPIYPGHSLALSQLRQMLEERRYRESLREPLRAGEFKLHRGSLIVFLRDFKFPGHWLRAQRVMFEFQQNRLVRIRSQEGDLAYLELEPIEIARLFGRNRESRLLVNIRQVPKHLSDAVIAIEDHRFYEHGGVDWVGILRAVWTDVLARRLVQGGSTITQQLVKNYFLEPERSLKRKMLEVSMASIIESMYEKDEILEMYLNEIYLGQRGGVAIHGIGEASRFFFGRNVEDLTLAESATLAGMIRSPNNCSPLTHPDAALERRNTVLKRMLDLEKITAQEYEQARAERVRVPGTFLPVNTAPYFVDYVRRQLQELYEPGVLESEGLNIYTRLHPEMALAAHKAVVEGLQELEKERAEGARGEGDASPPLQAALIAIQPKTGAVLALVGGRDYAESSFNRALEAHRQPGSTIKPFIYLGSLDRYTAASWIPDEPTPYVVDGDSWTPRNFDDHYRGRVTFRLGLEESINAATVNLASTVGLDGLIKTIRSLGIQSPLQPVPSLALGAFEVTPIELAGGYAALDNDGQRPFLLSLKEVVAENGEVQERRDMDFVTVTTPAKAFLITNLLEGAMERGSGKSVRRMGIDFRCAGKTGTTSDYRDSWFVGYTTDLLAVVWVGYDDNRPTGLTGARGAGRIWARFMNEVRPWMNPQAFRVPPGVVQRVICGQSGKLANPRCPDKRMEYFLAENELKEYCNIHRRE
ncbi:PBP1A family penicillin-binding protein [Syntrophobacter fumaroxidans]|uniref:Penicillin-binding protein 1B n=1 Tax=Syntrophobacter fumaroxidans (strain DSM 10017 / MPOB) TaxID=335543 RepID=A0LEY9_SYNFM|nr:PBP1A family penicillin-binding protein [Syntrophobacter fumaroxidans]ABK15991.1 penicillin-binding protein, 1A family [Syntrophobacter fumaroxidans MPOB]